MDNLNAWTQFALYIGALLLITKPLGLHLVRVLDAHGRTWLDPVVRPVERLTYRLCGIDPAREQGVNGVEAMWNRIEKAMQRSTRPESAWKSGPSGPRSRRKSSWVPGVEKAESMRPTQRSTRQLTKTPNPTVPIQSMMTGI